MTSIIDWLDHFLATPGALRAVAFGLLLSWSGTQALKFLPPLRNLGPTTIRLVVRAMAGVLALVAVLALWPAGWMERLLVGLTTALCSPTAYTIAVRVAYHWWPWLEPRMSATPTQARGRCGD